MSVTSRRGEDRRTAIVVFVGDFWTEHGYAPSLREIAEGVGLARQSSVAYQVDLLLGAGILQRTRGVARTLRVVEQ